MDKCQWRAWCKELSFHKTVEVGKMKRWMVTRRGVAQVPFQAQILRYDVLMIEEISNRSGRINIILQNKEYRF